MSPDMLLTGPLEPTNQWYAVAKIAGIKLCEAYRLQHGADFVSVMPTNLYGPGDNYHPDDSHVPAALMRRFHEAKINGAPSATVWGTGSPRREFLAVDDLGRCLRVRHEVLFGPAIPQCRDRRRHHHRRIRPRSSPTSSAIAAKSLSIRRGRTARRASFSMFRASMRWAGARRYRCGKDCSACMPTFSNATTPSAPTRKSNPSH